MEAKVRPGDGVVKSFNAQAGFGYIQMEGKTVLFRTGHGRAILRISKAGTGVFGETLISRVPKDGDEIKFLYIDGRSSGPEAQVWGFADTIRQPGNAFADLKRDPERTSAWGRRAARQT